MIYVTRLDGSILVVNADLIETVEHTADTVITLLDGKKLVVKTPVKDVVDSVIGYRQTIARGPLPKTLILNSRKRIVIRIAGTPDLFCISALRVSNKNAPRL